jgi:hypothetical protein
MQLFCDQAFLLHTFTKPADGKLEYWFYFFNQFVKSRTVSYLCFFASNKIQIIKVEAFIRQLGVSIFIALRLNCKVVRTISFGKEE